RAKGKAVSRVAVANAFKAVGDEMGLALGTHSMRKTRGWLMYNGGVSIEMICKPPHAALKASNADPHSAGFAPIPQTSHGYSAGQKADDIRPRQEADLKSSGYQWVRKVGSKKLRLASE
nr:hypothetical protein [Tanacetum cinerariifolium]